LIVGKVADLITKIANEIMFAEKNMCCAVKVFLLTHWRRGAVDIASTSGTRRPGFESLQGIRFSGYTTVLLCI
jgi:hypothetical protein